MYLYNYYRNVKNARDGEGSPGFLAFPRTCPIWTMTAMEEKFDTCRIWSGVDVFQILIGGEYLLYE